MMMLVPVPGFGPGVLHAVGNLCWYVDSQVFQHHSWSYGPSGGFDPEGILGTIPSIATVLFGVLTGYFLRSGRPTAAKPAPMFIAGFAMVLAGMIADQWLPINKNLWTSSFALFMGGWALVCFTALYWVIEVEKLASWTMPLRVLGMNAITLYVFSELFVTFLGIIPPGSSDDPARSLHGEAYSALLRLLGQAQNASLAYAIIVLGITWCLGWLLWKKKVFIRV